MSRKIFYIALGVVLAFAFAAIAPNARADEGNQATQMTFNQPIEIPGPTALGAGTYWFVTPKGINMSDVVQIYNADRTQLIATVTTIPTVRSEANASSELTFAEQSPNQPIALVSWFYPGLLTGHEFVYSPSEEAKLTESEKITVTTQPGSQG